jgi:diguanylate cyclase (GGDEF)-like protein
LALSQATTGVVALLAIYSLVMFVWVKNYEVLEEKYALSNVRRVQYLLQKESSMLAASVGDWAPWDDLYAFAQNPNQRSFVEKNLQDASMANLSVDIAVITDPNGKILFSKAVSRETKIAIPVTPELAEQIRSGKEQLSRMQGEKRLEGIFFLGETPMVFAAQRIYKSDHFGESPGILIFLRKIDSSLLVEMTEIVMAPVGLAPRLETTDKNGEKSGRKYIRSMIPLVDIHGQSNSAIYVDTPRTLTEEAQKQFGYFIVLMGILALLITLFSMIGLQHFLLNRLKQIEAFLHNVDISGKAVKTITLSGNDELSHVASSLNSMVSRIASSHQKIAQINIQLQEELAEREHAESLLQYSSEHDSLTGLHNRRYFESTLAHLRQTGAKGIGVICCDLDGLKLVNDTLGHAAGDVMLKRTAAILREVLPDSALIARVGGDEFIVLLKEVEELLLRQIYGKIQDYKQSVVKEVDAFPLQISVGYRYRVQCEPGSNDLDQMLKEADDEMYRQKLSSTHSNRNVVVQTIMKMLEIRDYATEGHSQRMGELAVELAERIGLPNNSKNDLRLLAQFHDLGKIGIPDQILLKPGPLTAEERKEIERHAEIGHRIAMVVPEFLPVADLILKHHEWWNGAGYPLGLQGEAIPVENRILSIVDAYDAMTSDRPYRAAMTQSAAIEELRRCRGAQFDPMLVDEFVALLTESTDRRVDFE